MKIKVTKFFPKQDRLVVKQHNEEWITGGGIIIPDTAKEKPQRGTVVAVGPEVDTCSVGEVIQYAKYAGTEIKFYNGGPEYIILRNSDVSGEIREYEIDDEVINPDTLLPWTPGEKKLQKANK